MTVITQITDHELNKIYYYNISNKEGLILQHTIDLTKSGDQNIPYESHKRTKQIILNSVDQTGTLQPATAVDSKTEGGEETKPASEGTASASAKDPDYARFAKGEWKPAFETEDSIRGARNAEFKEGVITLDDGFARDASAGAVSAKNMIVRAKIRGRGALFVRGGIGHYIAWLGEGMVGINKYVGRELDVLGTRKATLNPQAVHELAIAAVGDRVLLFVDGRRLVDVTDNEVTNAAAAALQSYQSKSEFKDVEVMSLDGLDAEKLLPEQDPLARAIGTWDVRRTLTLAGQEPRKSTGVIHIARAEIADFYLLRGTASDGSAMLIVKQFAPETSSIRNWIFFSNGQMDLYDAKLDPDTRTQTIPSHPVRNGTKSGVIRTLKPNTSETHFKTVGPDGEMLVDFVSLNKRRDAVGAPPDLSATRPADGAKQLAAHAPYVGHWKMEVKIRPTKFEKEAKTEMMLDDTEWILGGRFLRRLETKASGELASLQIGGYDPVAKKIVFTMFQSTGNVIRWTSTPDAATKTFRIEMKELEPGWTFTGSDRVVDKDTLETTGLLKDRDGGVIWDATITRQRRSVP